ncbi:hypothetical protein VM1G_09904 [Cytospora mali]|uniref:Spray n=1 Tax=Cytospora mali TaxID=578113 RepID=A0A194WDA5_CYTMA|nr:hypothetical protein VM1G_09904 [Valsa mali]
MALPQDPTSLRLHQRQQHHDDGDVSSPLIFSSRIESFREITDMDFGGYHYDGYSRPMSPSSPLTPMPHGRESLVSLPTTHGSSTPSLSRSGSRRVSKPHGSDGYQAVGGGGSKIPPISVVGHTASTRSTKGGRYSGSSHTTIEVIPEVRESIDIGLLPAAAPIDGSEQQPQYPPKTTPIPEALEWQKQEKAGRLSGGLGVGFKPGMTIRETDLLSRDDQGSNKTPSRSISFPRQKTSLNRSATRKSLGQKEADKTGKAVQVIIDDLESVERKETIKHRGSNVDLSVIAGEAIDSEELNASKFLKMRSTTFSNQAQHTETFYPQPDWKPFSMRWPYLLTLIALSIMLAVLTEVLYQSSAKNPLVSFHTPREIKPGVYFAIKFLPTIIAVVFGVLWQITDFEVKRLEAYYQLSKEGGATAEETLNVDYITNFSFWRPIRAFQLRQFAVTVSSIASLLAVSAVPTLSAASIVLSPNRMERLDDPTGLKEILVHPVWSRVQEVVLIIIAIMGCILFYQLSSRRSGLLADVKGIAGLAAMANVSHILMDFKDMDVATHRDIHQKLANHRYVLRNSSLAPLPVEDEYESSVHEKIFGGLYSGNMKAEPKYHLSLNPHPLMLRAAGSIPFITGIVLFTVLIPIFLFTSAGYMTDKVPWLVTALAVCIKLAWGAVDTNVRMMEPFYLLYRRHAPPKTLTLDYTAMPFAWVAFKALLNGHWLVFAVSFGTVMTEVLTVLVTSLAAVEGRDFIEMIKANHGLHGHDTSGPSESDIDAGQETVHSFWVSLGMVVFILLYMSVVATVVFIRRRTPFLPRQPNTIASVLGFIHQSKMLYDFVGTEKFCNREMVRFLEDIGKTYGLGWFEGRDGQMHCGVDQEQLNAGYRHGVDYSQSNKPWIETTSEWL